MANIRAASLVCYLGVDLPVVSASTATTRDTIFVEIVAANFFSKCPQNRYVTTRRGTRNGPMRTPCFTAITPMTAAWEMRTLQEVFLLLFSTLQKNKDHSPNNNELENSMPIGASRFTQWCVHHEELMFPRNVPASKIVSRSTARFHVKNLLTPWQSTLLRRAI